MNSGSFGFGNAKGFGKPATTTGQQFGTGTWGAQTGMGFMGGNQQQMVQQPPPNPVSEILKQYKYILQSQNMQDDSTFTCVMFNFCPADIRDDFMRDEKNRSLYGQYLKENPDPDNMVPVYVYGFDGLQKRIELQKTVVISVDKNLEVLQRAVTEIRVLVNECDRMARKCDERQKEIEEKMIRILGKIESNSSRSQVVVTNESFIESMVQLQRAVSLPSYPFLSLCCLLIWYT